MPITEKIKVLDHGYVQYKGHMGDDLMPLEAARMSTGNVTGVDEKKDNATRDYLWRHDHQTPYEMSILQVEVQCPIFVAREWMRHRTQSYNEFSLRYSEAIELFYVPEAGRIMGPDPNNKQGSQVALSEINQEKFINLMMENDEASWIRYKEALELGVSNELSRMLLPVNLYTKFRAQANLRNWYHFLNLRMAENAQYEIRVFANAVYSLVKDLWPKCSDVFEEHTLYAKKFSKTEMKILHDWVEAYLMEYSGRGAENSLTESCLNKSRIREFYGKLGI